MHTKDRLAEALTNANLPMMAAKAAEGYYDDFLSSLTAPQTELCDELLMVGTSAALALRNSVMGGDFDSTLEENDAWAMSADGKATMLKLAGGFG
jgi:hypothetical protein